jgi:hypothetical protein
MAKLTKEEMKKKGIAQLQAMAARWTDQDGEFRQYVTRRIDMLKMIGAGNTSGALALAVFLTTGTRTAAIISGAKIALLLFAIGMGAFVIALRSLYLFESDFEAALLFLRGGKKPESTEVTTQITSAFDRSEQSGGLVVTSLWCFILASLICFVGLIFS